HTWFRDNSKSQIDDIWTSYSILLDVTEPKLTTADESTKSDHKILSIEWNTADNWTKFSDDLIKKMDELQLHSPNIQNENHLNKYWNIWENLLHATVNKHIPYSYSSPQTFH
ncbi:8142_t:CDS:2, partial [Gigaspora margarita]